MTRILAFLFLLTPLVLTGCAGFDPSKITGVFNPQDYAGVTWIEHHAADGSTTIWRDGKDKSLLDAKITLPDGTTLSYSADDVTGVEAMRLRGEVQRALEGSGVEVSSATVDAVLRALRPPGIP